MILSQLFQLPAEIIQLIYDFAAPYAHIKKKSIERIII